LIIIAAVCGLIAGILGVVISHYYVYPDYSRPYFSPGEVNLASLSANNNGLVIRNPQKVVVNQDVKTTETISNIQPSLVGVFKAIKGFTSTSSSPIATSTATINPRAPYYNLSKPLFIGLIITSDGWVVALPSTNLKSDFKYKNYVVITNDRQIYQIDKISYLDKLPGDLMLLHLVGASNLPIKKIESRADLSLGQSLLIVSGANDILPTTLTSLEKSSQVSSSEVSGATLSLSAANISSFNNSFVFNLSGDLVAIITPDNKIVPAFDYTRSWLDLTQVNQVTTPFLGVNYLNLNLVKTSALSLNQGAWLYPSTSVPAVIKDSPADRAGFQAGDVITWVNNRMINANNDLSDLLSNYKAGDTITLTYWRAGSEKSVNVKLGQLK